MCAFSVWITNQIYAHCFWQQWGVYPIACVHGIQMKYIPHEVHVPWRVTLCSFLHTYQTMKVAYGLELWHKQPTIYDTRRSNPCKQPSNEQWSYMILEMKSNYHYLMGDLGNKYPSCELSFFGLNLHFNLWTKPPNPPLAILGLQVSFGTHTIWGPFILVMTFLGTQMEWSVSGTTVGAALRA